MLLLAGWAVPAGAALLCADPGALGDYSPSGIINDYWAGSGDPVAGNTSLTLGARRAGGAGNTIGINDMVLIIQIQDADITTTNSSAYGGTTATIRSSGQYQYVRADNAVGAGGGNLNFTPALQNNYHTRNYGSSGQSRWQAVRVPQYGNASASGVTALAWNGTTGGIVALDVENTLTLSGGTAINVAGLGFRGGAGRQLAGGAGADTDYRTLATVTTNASKGEGIAGVPRYLNNTSAYNAAPNVTDTGVEGYPNGSYARGAPGNGGGGGTDGNPVANDQNSGGGGGSNYGVGGQGGNAWSSGDVSGGLGGYAFSSILSSNKVFLGGGGGAGTTNNGTADGATYSAPPGLSCSAANGNCSSGAAGGGIVMVRAGKVTGFGLIDARGADAYNVLNDGAGGGGGGGTVLLQAYTDGYATVDVSGGNGGNAWRGYTNPIDRHGPGGGGGGGLIAYSPSTSTVVATYSAGLAGRSANNDAFGSTSGNGGITTFDLVPAPGIIPGTLCQPAIKAVRLYTDNGVAGAIDPGDIIEYTVVYRNISDANITGFNISDPLPAGMTYVAGSLSVSGTGGASPSANGSYTGASPNTNLLSSTITMPSGAMVTAKLRGTVTSGIATCSAVYNQADSLQSSGEDLGLSDNADNNQNVGNLPAGTYIDQTPYGTGGSTDRTGFTMGCPNLATSTKSWADRNGGDLEPGDILRYTITVTDTGGGTATGVTVTDDIPADVNSFAVISISDGGATNSSSPAPAGTNNNGYLNITGITVPAGGSVTIVFDVTVNNGTPNGTVINNSAVITNPLGPGGTPSAPPATVTDSSVPISGTKLLYLYDNAATPARKLSRTPTTSTNAISVGYGATQTWTMNPVAAAPITIDPAITSTVPVSLVLRYGNINTTDGNRSIRVELQCSSGGTILSDTRTVNLTTTRVVTTFSLTTTPAPWSTPLTCGTGESWILRVSNQVAPGTVNDGDDMRVYPYRAGLTPPNSRINLPATTVINVDSIEYYPTAYPPVGTPLVSVAPGATVHIRSVVSDPFGSYDINANPPATLPTVTISNPSGTVVLPATAMTELGALTTTGTKTFEYAYTVPASPTGNWTVRVDAVEGTEGTVRDYRQVAMPVVGPMPSLLMLKTSSTYWDPINLTSSPKPIPGAFVDYTILVTNTGPGAVDAGTTVITDPIPANTELFVGDITGVAGTGPILFSDGVNAPSTPSGLSYTFTSLASATDNLAFSGNNGADLYGKADTSADGNGCDATVTDIKIPLSGVFAASDGTNHPSFSVRFRVRIE